MPSVELFPYQIDHYFRMVNFLKNYPMAIDRSSTGSGKTVIAIALAKHFNLKLLVVAIPGQSHQDWKNTAEKYDVTVVNVMSYELLRGKNCNNINNDYLRKNDNIFTITPLFRNLVSEGVMVVFDEYHKLRNNTIQTGAAMALSHHIIKSETNSKVLCVSALPFSDPKHVISSLVLSGAIDHNINMDNLTLLYRHAQKFDANVIIPSQRKINKKQIVNRMIKLFKDVYINNILSECHKPINNTHQIDAQNKYCTISDMEERKLNKHLDKIYKSDAIPITKITQILQKLEKVKVNIIIKKVIKKLNKQSNSKVIVFVWYRESIEILKSGLSKFNPQILSGKTKNEDRCRIISKFQEESLNSRLLLSHPDVGGSSVNLDDISGKYPRTMYIVPKYNFISQHQLPGRISRPFTQSKATIRVIFLTTENDISVMSKIKHKTEFCKLFFGKNEHIVYPGDFITSNDNCSNSM